MIAVTTEQHLDDVLDANDEVLLVFTQPSWCAPCRALHPHLVELEKQSPVPIVTIGEDAPLELYGRFGVRGGVPQILAVKSGNPVGFVKARTVIALMKELETAFGA